MSADPEKAVGAPGGARARKSDDSEKGRSSEIEQVDEDAALPRTEVPLYNAHVDISGIDERKLIRKMDWHLVPWLSFLYLLSFLDRTSIGNAKVCCGVVRNLGMIADDCTVMRLAVQNGGRSAH